MGHLLIGFTFVIANILTGVFFISFATIIGLPGSVLPNRWWLFPLIYLLPSGVLSLTNVNISNVMTITLTLGIFGFPVAKELRVGRRNSVYEMRPEFRQTDNLMRTYKSMEILVAKTNRMLGPILFPMQSLSTLVCVFGSFEVIKHRGFLETKVIAMLGTWAFILPVTWSIVLIIGGYVHNQGNKILSSWKQTPWGSRKERVVMAKFRRSCRPLMMAWGKAFVLKRVSILVFYRGLTRGIVRALLAFREY